MSLSGHDRRPRRLLDPPPHLAERYFASKKAAVPHGLPDRAEPEQLGLAFNPAPTWEELMAETPDPAYAAGRAMLERGPAWNGTDRRLTILSCGLGQDSMALALMVANGDHGMDRFRSSDPAQDLVVVFYDTGAEWPHTYELIPRLEAALAAVGIPFYVLEKPPLEAFFADPKKTWTRHRHGETLEEAAARGRFHNEPDLLHSYYWAATVAARKTRSCTSKHKVSPSRKFMDALDRLRFGLDNPRRGHLVKRDLAPRNRVLLGICADEADRAHHANLPWYEESEYPLLDTGITKHAALDYLHSVGWTDVSKSGCDACPFSRKSWFWMLRETDPERFALVEQYERVARRRNAALFVVGDDLLGREVAAWRSRHRDMPMADVLARGYERPNSWGADEEAEVDPADRPPPMVQTSMFANPEPTAASVEAELESRWPGLVISMSDRSYAGTTVWHLHSIVVPKAERKRGIGTAAMELLTERADEAGATVGLTPETDFGGTSVARLRRFYGRFGFRRNRGRYADHRLSAAMFRRPRSANPQDRGSAPDWRQGLTARVLFDWSRDGYRSYMDVPRYALHTPPAGYTPGGGVPAYRPWSFDRTGSSEGDDLRRLFRGMFDADAEGLVFLAPVYDLGRCEYAGREEHPAVVVDLAALDPERLRLTGQAEGFVVHAGDIADEAVVAVVTGREDACAALTRLLGRAE